MNPLTFNFISLDKNLLLKLLCSEVKLKLVILLVVCAIHIRRRHADDTRDGGDMTPPDS